MRRPSVAALAIALLLSGCPLPQPLPTYPANSVTPPRILAATTTSGVQSIITVPANCATPPSYALDATVFYQETVSIEARWFVDYRTDVASRYAIQNPDRQVPPNPNSTILVRPVPTFTFQPYGYPLPDELSGNFAVQPSPADKGVLHVVELVVSNGFASAPADAAQPNRTPANDTAGNPYEIQTYRWTFVSVPEDPTATCTPGDIGCARCPP